MSWRRGLSKWQLSLPILQAPMAGAQDIQLAIAAAEANALGALPCAMLSPEQIEAQVRTFRTAVPGSPLNLNFFCHSTPAPNEAAHQQWQDLLAPLYAELGLEMGTVDSKPSRMPFDQHTCEIVETTRPEFVSFHFGLPDKPLLDRVKAAGAIVLSSATCVAEALWLRDHGADGVIAQGIEAGGHRGTFLADTQPSTTVTENLPQVGTMALVPQIADAVDLPVIAAGGIADARGIVASLALGASGVQIGSAFLPTTQSTISAAFKQRLQELAESGGYDTETVLTNLFSGRPARGLRNTLMDKLGHISAQVPAFPTASNALGPLKTAAEAKSRGDFSPLWLGQAGAIGWQLGHARSATALVEHLVQSTDTLLGDISLGE